MRTNRQCLHAIVVSVVLLTVSPASLQADVLTEVHALMNAGRFAEAEALIAANLPDPTGPVVNPLAIAGENMRRIRLDYPLSPDDMLAKLKRSLPDVTAADVRRWQSTRMLQYRVIDGKLLFFKREPSNLFRFCKDATKRRTNRPAPTNYEFDLPRHAARLLELAERTGDPQVFPVRHRVRYTLKVNNGLSRLKPGATVRCWLPYPQVYRQQGDVKLIDCTGGPAAVRIAPNGAAHRTLYFEHTVQTAGQGPRFDATFEFTTAAFVPRLDAELAQPIDRSSSLFKTYTAERPPHIVFDQAARWTARMAVGTEANPLRRAQLIFRWINDNIRYCAEMEYSTIPNLSGKALASGQGDCGVQGMTFITLCRAAGIPARWQSGWESLPNGWNMHDWAEFYVEPWGWLPADASYGVQKHPDEDVQLFFCGRMDAYRMIVNLDYARPLEPAKTSYRSEPNDFQRGEVEIDGHNLYFNEWDWTFRVETTPLIGGTWAVEEVLDSIVPDLLVANKLRGAIIGVGQLNDQGGWVKKAYGFQAVESPAVPMGLDAVFDLCALRDRVALAGALVALDTGGLLQLDFRVSDYVKSAKDAAGALSVRDLLTVLVGTPTDNPRLSSDRAIALATALVETVTESPLDTFVNHAVIKQAGMKSTNRGAVPGSPGTDHWLSTAGDLERFAMWLLTHEQLRQPVNGAPLNYRFAEPGEGGGRLVIWPQTGLYVLVLTGTTEAAPIDGLTAAIQRAVLATLGQASAAQR